MSAVIFEKRDHVAWLTINRPEAKNIMNADVFVLLSEAWEEVRDDKTMRVAILTATGSEDFCCGGDLGNIIPLWTGAKQPETEIEKKILDATILDKAFLKNMNFYKPLIAAINGRALGGGTEIIEASDIRIAAEHATFALPEPKRGVIPGGGSMVRLARQIPYAHAMKILMTGETIDAPLAQRIGLINDIVPHNDLLTAAEEMADKVLRCGPLALQAIKRTVIESQALPWDEAFRYEMEQSATVMGSHDSREGPKAFKEKREPIFLGE